MSLARVSRREATYSTCLDPLAPPTCITCWAMRVAWFRLPVLVQAACPSVAQPESIVAVGSVACAAVLAHAISNMLALVVATYSDAWGSGFLNSAILVSEVSSELRFRARY